MKNIKLNHIISESIKDLESDRSIKINNNFLNDLINELSQYKSDEQLLRNGGLSIELLDRLAHGFSEEDIKLIHPKDLKIKWKTDLENVLYEIKKSGLTNKQWASKIKLSEPIDVSYWEDKRHKKGFYVEDGHHRYVAAKILNKPLNVSLDIKINPIKEISPNMGYDEIHRYLYNRFKK